MYSSNLKSAMRLREELDELTNIFVPTCPSKEITVKVCCFNKMYNTIPFVTVYLCKTMQDLYTKVTWLSMYLTCKVAKST